MQYDFKNIDIDTYELIYKNKKIIIINNILKKFKKKKEKDKQINIKNTYGKKPKGICPKCRRKTLFMTNKDGEVYCIRCDNRVK